MHDRWECVMGAQLMLKQVLVFNVSTVLKKDLRRQKKGEIVHYRQRKYTYKSREEWNNNAIQGTGNLIYFGERVKMLAES